MVKNKKKYHTYKSFMDAKDFKHNKLTIWFDKKVEKKLLNKLYKLANDFIDEKKIRSGKKSPIIVSALWQDPGYKYKLAGPFNTPQSHNLIVGVAKRKDEWLSWKRSMIKKPNIDLVNYIINESDDMQSSEYQSDEVKWCKKELLHRNHIYKGAA